MDIRKYKIYIFKFLINVMSFIKKAGKGVKDLGSSAMKVAVAKIIGEIAADIIKEKGIGDTDKIMKSGLKIVKDLGLDPKKKLFLGELSLQGELRGVKGVLSIVQEAKRKGSAPISKSRGRAPAALLVCRVAKTKCPVKDAWIANSAVSLSRISPTRMTFGS